jgi:hypothetical protein
MAQQSRTRIFLNKAGNIFQTQQKGKKKTFSTISTIVPILSVLIDYLEKQGRDTEGIFRVNGSVPALQSLKADITNRPHGEPLLPSDEWDPHVVAGLIKLLLRELDEPLFPFTSYDSLINSLQKEDKETLSFIKSTVDSLPRENKVILYKLLDLFSKLDCSEVTKMSAHNLAVVMGPTVLRPAGESFETMMSDSSKVVAVVTFLIQNANQICKDESVDTEPVVKDNIGLPPLVSEREKREYNREKSSSMSSQSIGLPPLAPEKRDKISSQSNLLSTSSGPREPREPSSHLVVTGDREKRELKKKYDDLKKSYDELFSNYDELRTQYSVLEAYSTKLDAKVLDLEDLLEYFEHSSIPKTESESQQTTTESHVEGEEDIVQKLRQENDLLREVIIRSTREEICNYREDSIRIRSPREYPSVLGKKGGSFPFFTPPLENSPRSAPELPIFTSPTSSSTSTSSVTSPTTTTNSTTTPATTEDGKPTEGRKSTKYSNSFIRKQNSAKKIQQKVSKVIKVDAETTAVINRETTHKREHSASTSRKSLIRKDTENMQLDKKLSVLEFAPPTVIPSPAVATVPSSNSDTKLPPLQSINEGISKTQKDESDPKSSGYTPRNSQGETNNARSRRSVRVHEEIPGVSSKQSQQPMPLSTRTASVPQTNGANPSPGKPSLFRSTTIGSAISSALRNASSTNQKGSLLVLENNENIPPTNNPVGDLSLEKDAPTISPRHNKVTLPDVFQKVNELERKFSGKERAFELEQAGLKKQVEEMKVSLDTLVMAITVLTEKIIT